jgi:LPXTG-site transpeptidase (sortase) family protein
VAPTALPAAGPPLGVLIGSLGIDAPVLRIATDGTTLEPPPDPQDLGWWAQGAPPGAAIGSALITGHTVHDGGGALDDLEMLRPGAEIRVRTMDGLIRYVAESVEVFDKDTIARKAPQLFSQQVDGRLVLVTCEDWDGTGYRSNVVVTAVPVP